MSFSTPCCDGFFTLFGNWFASHRRGKIANCVMSLIHSFTHTQISSYSNTLSKYREHLASLEVTFLVLHSMSSLLASWHVMAQQDKGRMTFYVTNANANFFLKSTTCFMEFASKTASSLAGAKSFQIALSVMFWERRGGECG